MEKFYLTLRKENNTDDRITIYMTPTGHALSQFWMDTMKENFLQEGNISDSKPLNKKFCFHAWQSDWNDITASRNLDVLCEEVNIAIEQVNHYYVPFGYPYIDLFFSKDALNSSQYRSMMNDLHHNFELLIGQVENPSPWYDMPKVEAARYYVQQLNALCHEIEAIVNKIEYNNGEKAILINYACSRFDATYEPEGKRHDLTLEHYECFEDTAHQWGMLTAYYSQLGKQHIEVYVDNDSDIHDENITGIQYMLGECILTLGNNEPGVHVPRLHTEYKEWLIANGFDVNDPTLALGLGVLANIVVEDNKHLGDNWKDIDNTIKQYNDIYEVGFCDAGTLEPTVSQVYDYTWRDHQSSVLKVYGK